MFFFFKQKTAYEMRISDWRSDVCSSDLRYGRRVRRRSLHWRRPSLQQFPDDEFGCFFGAHLRRVDANFGGFGRLIRSVDAGEVLELAFPRFLVEALDVALLVLGQRRVYLNLDELALRQHPQHLVPFASAPAGKGVENTE